MALKAGVLGSEDAETLTSPDVRRPPSRSVRAYPVLFVAYPVLFLWSSNLGRVPLGDALKPLFTVLTVGTALFIGLRFLVGSARAANLIMAMTFLFFGYGYAHEAMYAKVVAGRVLDPDVVLLPLLGLMMVSAVVIVLRGREPRPTSGKILNVVSLALVLASAIPIAGHELSYAGTPVGLRTEEPVAEVGEARLRDIVMIVPDRYGGTSGLKQMGFDNEPFLDALEDRGFFVARDSKSNYPATSHSLASSLNMEYLDVLANEMGEGSSDWEPLYDRIRVNRVASFLKARGYEYVLLGSWWEATRTSPLADVELNMVETPEFERALWDSTALRPIFALMGGGGFDQRRAHHDRVLDQFELLRHATRRGPTFTLAHILSPHYPFTFDREGNFVELEDELNRTFEENYLGQVEFVNERLLSVIDELLARPVEERPIVVLQADEGPHPAWVEKMRTGFSWRDASQEDLRLKFPILNAVYHPEGNYDGLHDSISPVNQFRWLFDREFGTHLGLLRDRSFIYEDWGDVYSFADVTARLDATG